MVRLVYIFNTQNHTLHNTHCTTHNTPNSPHPISPPHLIPPNSTHPKSPPPPKKQVGLNGIDNGALRFTHVRVPRENLLDRFGSVDRSGKYTSAVPSASKRFAATLGELTGGRVGLVSGSVGVLKVRGDGAEKGGGGSVMELVLG